MEAVSARMAQRDRYGMGNPGPSQLQRYVLNACDPSNYEPNLALNLEIADLINSKKGNAPREAAFAIVNYINHRNSNVSLLALALLDICVKNCGYPFHLQISTKEFLNELVRRFPERPPLHPSRVQMKILEAIEEWTQTICKTSKYKEDLGFIRDMHRLLSYKRYTFPEVRKEDAAVLNPSDNLKSAEEMEEEERAAQSAKLQELIRRGGPQDLQEANRLMKIMAGYDTRNKTDFRAKAAEDVQKIQQKAHILEEMMDNHKEGNKFNEDDDVFHEIASALRSAQPKIQKMCEEESEDADAVLKLLEINDNINAILERYKLMRKGDYAAAAQVAKSNGKAVASNSAKETSLIDLDDLLGSGSQEPAPQPKSLEDDLLGLSFEDKSYGQGGAISLGFGTNTNLPGPPLLSSQTQQSTSSTTQGFTPPMPSTAQASAPVPPQKPNYQPFAAVASSSSASRTQSPANFSAFSTPAVATTPQPAFHAQPPAPAQAAAPNADDEWTFASSLPVENNTQQSLPSSNQLNFSTSALRFVCEVNRPRTNPAGPILVACKVSNMTAQQVSDVVIQFAVTKGLSLQLAPQSTRTLAPRQVNGITQLIRVLGVETGKGGDVKMRWKVSCKVGDEPRDDAGMIESLSVG